MAKLRLAPELQPGGLDDDAGLFSATLPETLANLAKALSSAHSLKRVTFLTLDMPTEWWFTLFSNWQISTESQLTRLRFEDCGTDTWTPVVQRALFGHTLLTTPQLKVLDISRKGNAQGEGGWRPDEQKVAGWEGQGELPQYDHATAVDALSNRSMYFSRTCSVALLGCRKT